MARARRDVDLVIRARNEASDVLVNITQALQRFNTTQQGTQTEGTQTSTVLDRLGTALRGLRTSVGGGTVGATIARELGQARSAYENLRQSIRTNTADLDRYNAEIAESSGVTAQLQTRLAGATAELNALRAASRAIGSGTLTGVLRRQVQEVDRLGQAYNVAQVNQRRLEASARSASNALSRQNSQVDAAAATYSRLSQEAKETAGALEAVGRQTRRALLQAFGEQNARVREAAENFRRTSQAAQEYARRIRSVQAPSRELTGAFEAARASAAQWRQELRNQQTELNRVRQIYRETGGDVDSFVGRQQRAAEVLRRAAQSQRQSTESSRAAVAANERLGVSQRRATQTAAQQATATERLAGAQRRAASSGTGLAAAFRAVHGSSRQSLSILQRIRSEILAITTAYVGVFAVFRGVGGIADAARTLQQVTNRLLSVFDGDQSAVSQELDFLRRTAERLGLSFRDVANEYSKFAVATTGTNLAGEATRKIFIAVAEAARVQGLSNEQLQGTFVALTQIVSKGVVSMEELRRQLGDRLPGAIQIMAEGLEITTAELIELVSTGKLASDSLLPFAEELNRRFGGQLPSALTQLAAAIGRVGDASFRAFLRVGQAGAVDGFADALNRMNEFLRSGQLDSIFDRIGVAVGALASFVALAAENFRPLLAILALIAGRRIAPLFIALAAALGTIPAKARAAAAGMTVLGAQSAAAASGMTLAATATRGLRIALTALLSATGIGALVALVSAGIALWVTRTEEATDAQNQHLKIVDQVKNAYDAVGDSVVQLRDRLQDVTATQALRNLQRLEEQLQNLREEIVDAAKPGVFEAFGDRLSRLYGGRESRARAVMAGAIIRELEILSQRFLAGEFGSTRLRQEIDRLVTTFGGVSPALATQAAQLLDIVDRFDLVNGRVAQAQFIYTGLTGTVEVAGEAFRRVAKETAAVANPLERQLKALEAFQIGLQALTTELPGGADAGRSRAAAEALGSQVEELRRLASEAGVGEEAINALYEQILQFQRADEIFEGASSGLSAIGRILEEGTELSSTAIAEQALIIRNRLASSVGEGIVEALTSRQQAVLGAIVQAFGELPEGLAELVQQGIEQGSSSGVAQFVRSLEGLPNANLLATVFGGEDFDIDALIQAEERLATLRERTAERQRQQQARLAEQERQRIERSREATQQTIEDLEFQIQQQSLISIGEERRAAIEESLRNARQQNANISVQELQAIENRVGLLFDIENRERIIAEGRERAAAAEQRAQRSYRSSLATHARVGHC